jgi:catechol 2,3-dioxygenase-like lactoylglutathione lyase family enzyme
MNLRCQHAVIRVRDIKISKEFYIDTLGLELIEEMGNFFAARAGGVRLSFFGGYEKPDNPEDIKTGVSLILRVDNLDTAKNELSAKNIEPLGDVIDIPNFHKFLEYEDSDGNVFFLAEYHVEPV